MFWQAPEVDDRNGIIIYYRVVLRDETFDQPDIVVNASANAFSFNDLEEYITYSCIVTAATSVGEGPFSMAVNFTTLEDGLLPILSIIGIV